MNRSFENKLIHQTYSFGRYSLSPGLKDVEDIRDQMLEPENIVPQFNDGKAKATTTRDSCASSLQSVHPQLKKI